MAITTLFEHEDSYKSWYEASEKAFAEFFEEMATASTPARMIGVPLFPMMDASPCPSESSNRKVSQKGRPKKRKADDILTKESPVVESIGHYISPEERGLRAAEACILFPKYMDRYQAKRMRLTSEKRQSGQNRLPYLPSEEYITPWGQGVYRCPPSMDQKQVSRTLQYFKQDCRNPGAPIAKNIPNAIENDPRYYNLEWNQRLNPLRPAFVDPPEKGSLDDNPFFPCKKLSNPLHKATYDSFVLELKRAMGPAYIDLNELRYYPRSDGRADPFWDEKSKKFKTMINAKFDIEHYLRNREIERAVKAVKTLYEIRGLAWSNDIAEEWDRRIVQFVNPKRVCNGRAFHYEMKDLGVTDGRHVLPEPLEQKITEPPAAMHEDDLGSKFYWSGREGRMVTFDDLRQHRTETLVSDLDFHNSTIMLSEGIGTRSKSISPTKDKVEGGAMS